VTERWRGQFNQSEASRRLQQELSQTRFNTGRRGVFQRPGGDLSGRGSLGRASDSRTFANGQRIAEAVGFYLQGEMNQAVAGIHARIVKERLSAPKILIGRGKYFQKNPISAGLRQIDGKLVGSLRVRAFTPGTTRRAFKGVYRILAQIGGPSLGKFDYADFHEKKGRLQFRRTTDQIFSELNGRLRAGAAQIALRAGARVS
jgi:hypothetical protein